MGNQDNKSILDAYKEKSSHLEKSYIIFLGVAIFFFFMILVPV